MADRLRAWMAADLDPELVPWTDEDGVLGKTLRHPLVYQAQWGVERT